ncbi:hypothetical protein OJAV_G00069000 [Oryzias javanicus]|uniref:Syntaphilin a n=1 Tax=Oryzias javanicus TaxID=123683 RepID=A0A3S2UH66_ORYJA|nr:hypothetical protein OJAV_G00069000 [Oryzias javanicus]
MSLTPSRKPASNQRRRSVGTSGVGGRHALSDASSTHTYPCRARAPEGSPTARTYPSTPRRQMKHTACSDNHGIRPPSAEQYLTPLQQKEVCIRHLRARLRENVERLHHRDYEIEELRTQLYKMQEDWIEEECHRVEAQLALKEARKEIQHLQEVVESVRSNLGIREKDQHDHKPYLGLQGARPGGRSRSCGCSPASTLSRGAACGRQSGEALQAALLSDQLPPQTRDVRGPSVVPCSSNHDRMCGGGAVLPVSHSCHTLSSSCLCSGRTYLPHHHLFLHLPQEEVPVRAPTTAAPTPTPTNPIPVPVVERKPEVRSQACSPTMTWLQEESGAEELSVISLAPADSPPSEMTLPAAPPPERSTQELPAQPLTSQPQPAGQGAPTLDENAADEDEPPPPLCHWSRYFLVDLMALAMPVVPTVAWLCRGAPQEVMPVYHIGSLLRGCCAVALHSLRQQGAGRGRRPASMNGTT